MPVDTNPSILLLESDADRLVLQCSCGKLFIFDDDDYVSDIGAPIAKHLKQCHLPSEASRAVDSGT